MDRAFVKGSLGLLADILITAGVLAIAFAVYLLFQERDWRIDSSADSRKAFR